MQPSLTTVFSRHPLQRRRRSPCFVASVVFHCGLILLLALTSADTGVNNEARISRKYSVRLIELGIARPQRTPSAPGTAKLRGALAQAAKAGTGMQSRQNSQSAASAGTSAAAFQESEIHPRVFQLPPITKPHPSRQSLVQLDVPPDLTLKPEMQLPVAILWTEDLPTPAPRRFTLPPVKQRVKVAQNLAAAPVLKVPNAEKTVADLEIATAALPASHPFLPVPPATVSPVRIDSPEQSHQIPQSVSPDSKQASAGHVIILPDTPVLANTVIVIPPVNDVASAGVSGQGASAAKGHGTGASGNGSGSSSGSASNNSGSGTGNLAGNGNNSGGVGSGTGAGAGQGLGAAADGSGLGNGLSASSGSSTGSRAGSGSGNSAGGTGNSGSGTGAGASGTGSGGSGLDGTFDTSLYTRIALPKEGKFNVIVLGSSISGPYPESVGALSGKLVYTVYVGVGLRKNWILQYCLPKGAEHSLIRGGSTPLAAPWPYLMVRPNQLNSLSFDYVMVHAMLTAEGHFDQLALVLPDQLAEKDLLLRSLRQWEFRPAAKDGVPTSVEVLLIIPREPD